MRSCGQRGLQCLACLRLGERGHFLTKTPMKQTAPSLVLILTLIGCSSERTTQNSNGRVPFASALEPLIGKWASDGKLALIVERDGNDIVVRNLENDTWRFEITDVSTDGTSVMFTQRNWTDRITRLMVFPANV